MKEYNTDDMLYVIVTHLDKVDPAAEKGDDVYFGIIAEDETKVQFCCFKGGEQVGLQQGSLGEIPKVTLLQQMEEGIVEKIEVDYYVSEFHKEK